MTFQDDLTAHIEKMRDNGASESAIKAYRLSVIATPTGDSWKPSPPQDTPPARKPQGRDKPPRRRNTL